MTKYYIYIATTLLLILSCQIKDENAPTPADSFIKYYGESISQQASDIEIIYDGETPQGLIVFGTKTSTRGDNDYFVMRTDLNGTVLDSIEFGLSDSLDLDNDGIRELVYGNEAAGQIEQILGVGFVVIGTIGIQNKQRMSYAFLDEDLQLIPDKETGKTLFYESLTLNGEDIVGNDVILLSEGNEILLVGGQENTNSDFDNFYQKITFEIKEGEVEVKEVFDLNQGIAGYDDVLIRAFEKESGNLVLIGNTSLPSSRGENGGTNGTNIFYLETNSNGFAVNSVVFGFADPNPANTTIYNEEVSDAIKTTFGYAIVGTSTTSEAQEFAFLLNISPDGVLLSGSNHDKSAFNTEGTDGRILQTRGNGVTQTKRNNLVILGQYPNFVSSNGVSRGAEGMFVALDQATNSIANAESFFGLPDGNDNLIDAVTLPDGKIIAIANVDFGGGIRLMSIIKLNDDGTL